MVLRIIDLPGALTHAALALGWLQELSTLDLIDGVDYALELYEVRAEDLIRVSLA